METLAEWLCRSDTGTMRFRVMMENTWFQPAEIINGSVCPIVYGSAEEGEWLTTFTDREHLETHQAAIGKEWEFVIERPGYELFLDINPACVGVDVNPETAHAVHYRPEQFERLTHWARIGQIEQILSNPDAYAHALQRLRDYDNWYMAVRGTDGDRQFALAPDDQARALAAAFTAEDLAQAFVQHAPVADELGIQRMSGTEFFGVLQSDERIQGVVFNAMGPVTPRAFSKALAQMVLSAT